MINANLPGGLVLRPARDSDSAFLASLYNSTRDDLRMIDGERDFVESLIEQQHDFQTRGYGDQYPNAMNFIVEKLGESIGRVALDFGHNEVHVLDIALIPAARGHGYGKVVVQSLQTAAAKVAAPLTLTVMRHKPAARALYLSLGFQVTQSTPMADLMIWHPTAQDMGKKIFVTG